MAKPADDRAALRALQPELTRLCRFSLSSVVDNVDRIIDRLAAAREDMARAPDASAVTLKLAKLQNPIKEGLEAVHESLKAVSKVQKPYGRVLTKTFPKCALPLESDDLKKHSGMIHRAVAMHLLREGEFSVVEQFLSAGCDLQPLMTSRGTARISRTIQRTLPAGGTANARSGAVNARGPRVDLLTASGLRSKRDRAAVRPPVRPPVRLERRILLPRTNDGNDSTQDLRERFSDMRNILIKLRAGHLGPAIEWAGRHSGRLEARGSDLEFELVRQQFLLLLSPFGNEARWRRRRQQQMQQQQHSSANKTAGVDGIEAVGAGALYGTYTYAHLHFNRFQRRYLDEIQAMSCAMVYAPNLGLSPYQRLLDRLVPVEQLAEAVQNDFCGLLGLTAESPLHVVIKAGALALPQLVKFTKTLRGTRTEWTQKDELAFETPVPRSMLFHTIFVCPVQKVQATAENPPMMMPCGHVVCRDSLKELCKGNRFKCPYCPTEGQLKDAVMITF